MALEIQSSQIGFIVFTFNWNLVFSVLHSRSYFYEKAHAHVFPDVGGRDAFHSPLPFATELEQFRNRKEERKEDFLEVAAVASQ